MKYNNSYVVSISESVSYTLFGLFNSLLANKIILPSIGDVSKESDTIKVFDYQKLETPNDPIRKKYAYHLTTVAMHFLVEHELTHILDGHCDFVQQKFKINYISEAQQNTINQDNLDYQTLEMDADCIAASRCVNHICNVVIGDSTVHRDYSPFLENIYDSIFHFSFALSTMFHLFGEVDYKNMEVGKSTHPSTHLREYMVRGAVLVWFQQSSSFLAQKGLTVDIEKLVKSLMSGYIEAIKTYYKATGRTEIPEKYEAKYTNEHPLMSAVLRNWRDKIYHALTPLTFQKLVSPK
jgi:hypothetical protein